MNLETVKSATIKKFEQMESEDKKKFIGRGILLIVTLVMYAYGGFCIISNPNCSPTVFNFIPSILFIVGSCMIGICSVGASIIYLFNGFKWPF